jgi:diguanylate cyclase (GGDEF)-like protein/PAS domain S-box-containing protein
MTRQTTSHSSLKNVKNRFEIIFDSSPNAVLISQLPDGYISDANHALATLTGYSIEELIGNSDTDLKLWVNPKERRTFIGRLKAKGACENFEAQFRRKDGSQFIGIISAGTTNVLGTPNIVSTIRDITERRKIEHRNEMLMQRHMALMSSAIDGIHIMDIDGNIVEANDTFCQMLGYSYEEAIRLNVADWDAQWSREELMGRFRTLINMKGAIFETKHRRKNGTILDVEVSTTGAIIDGQPYLFATSHDITDRKASEEKIQHLAFYDHLTNLPNRRLLMDRLQQALASSARSGREGALLFIDLDHFKNLNDTLGHDIGDMLLQQVTHRLEFSIREGDTVARLGGDEFVVMLLDLSDQSLEAATQAEAVGEKILVSLSESYQLGKHVYRCTASIGVTLFSGNQQTADELMKQADIAMYQAKKAGRNALRFFDRQMQENISARVSLENELHNAIEFRQFHLYYQIQVDNSHRPLGAEALIRWAHPARGLIMSAQFIPLAEETGLILPIGLWVLETACAQIKAWEQDSRTRNLTLAVNVSAKQFRQADFVVQVQSAVKRHEINPMLLKLELTESLLQENIEETIATMNALNEIGVQFSLDDFGTGYSSLQYLKRLPLDQLKIDQSFVRDIAVDGSDIAVVRATVAMARSLSLDVIAEGVETDEQRQLLQENGCTNYQGYLFGQPVPVEQFESLLD